MSLRYRWLAVLLCAFVHASVRAQTGKRYAVLVGVNEYDHPKLAPLKYAVNDASAMADELDGAGYDVTLLTAEAGARSPGLKPTRANVEARVKAVLARCAKGDTVLVGMAGHGVQFEGQRDSFFCPVDGKPFADEAGTLFSLGGLYADFDRSNAGVKVLLVDACRDDPVGGRGIDADTAPKPPSGVAALFSCRAGERAFEHDSLRHGVFFHHVLEGLKGEAADKRGRVTLLGLAGHVTGGVAEAVPTLIGGGAKQSPNLKADISNELVLVPAGGRWTRLLDGKLEDTWETLGKVEWAVSDRVLKGSAGTGWLATKASYADFELSLEYRLPTKGNSGVFLRAWKEGSLYGDDFAEVQLLDDAGYQGLTPDMMTGSLWKKAARDAVPDAPADAWNRVVVRVVGERVYVAINGAKCLDREVRWDRTSGPIGLQNHRTPVEFRNVRVREIADGGKLK